jgi:hypothetical protein
MKPSHHPFGRLRALRFSKGKNTKVTKKETIRLRVSNKNNGESNRR